MMMGRFSFGILMVALFATGASGQRPHRVFTPDPDYWLSGGIGGVRGDGVNDGATASTWNFGNSTNLQYRAAIEKGWTNGSSFGISGTYSKVPFVYSSNLATPLPGGAEGTRCGVGGCNAHLDMMSLLAMLHYGSGAGLHSVVEAGGGIVMYNNLKRDSDGARLAGGNNIDPMFTFDWGLGYGFSERTNLDVVWDWSMALHERAGQSNGLSNTNTMPGLRVQLRMGFGNRSLTRR
jgi:hypothetical protein